MAETAGLIIGAVSLTAIFTTCVDCFEYIQLGRNFGKDYQRSLLKLDIAKLRLSRWANAVNESHDRYQVPVGTPAEAQKVEELLGEIMVCFEDAARVSERFKTKSGNPTGLQVAYTDNEMEPSLQAMHEKMRDLALRRQRRSGFRQKTAWVLFEKKPFDRLISDVTELVEQLIQLFPATQPRQRELVVEEIREIEAQPALTEVKTAAEGIDTLLVSSIQQTLAAQGSHNFNKSTVTDEADAQFGDQYAREAQNTGAGHTYNESMASRKAKAHFGNKYL